MGTRRWFFWVSLGTVLILIYKFLDNFSGIGKWIGSLIAVLTPFLIAILLAYILYMPCKKIENLLKKTRIKHTRGLSIAIIYIIVGIILFFVLKFIIPTIFSSIVDLVNNIQGYYNAITMNELEESWAPFVKDNILKPVVEYIQKIDIPAMITQGKITEYLSSAMGFIKGIFNLFISLICSIYILSSREKIIKAIDRFAKAVMSVSGYKKFNRYFTEGNRIFFKFISSQVIDACVVSIIMTIALSIMKIKYALFLGILIGIFNLIPYFGAIMAVIIATLITILTGGWKLALIMAIVMIILQQIDANIINPRITSSKLDISPLLVIFSVTVGGAYFGILGMFIGVPIAVLIKLMLDDYIKNKEKMKTNSIETKEKI